MKSTSPFLLGFFSLIALIGFADAAYLTAKHYAGVIPPCSLTNGCETVLTSAYAAIGNIPISLIGAAYYLLLFIACVIYFDSKNTRVLKAAAYFTTAGFLTSLILVTLQIFVIQALCLYCLVSATTSITLFVLGLIILKKLKKSDTMQSTANLRPEHELMKLR